MEKIFAQHLLEIKYDVFVFSGLPGIVKIDAQPNFIGPNLDILLELLDSSYSVIATSNPANELNAFIEYNTTRGKYFVRISGTGKGTLSNGYSDYGSIGKYRIILSHTEKQTKMFPVDEFFKDFNPRRLTR